MPGKVIRVDFLDEAQKWHSPRVIVVVARNAVKEYLLLGLQPQLPDETGHVVLVLFWSASVVDIAKVQNHVDSLTDHHVLKQLVAVL